jgi:hypothetical protein
LTGGVAFVAAIQKAAEPVVAPRLQLNQIE